MPDAAVNPSAPPSPSHPPVISPPTPPEPKVFAGKFKSVEEMEKGYQELERQFHSTRPKPKDELSIAQPEADDSADIPTLIDKSGLKLIDLESQWSEHGKLTDEQYAAIRKTRPSLTKRDVDFIAEGLQAQAVLRNQAISGFVNEAQTIAGGKDQLAMLRQWAAENISPDRLSRLNKQVNADAGFYPDMIRLIAAEHAAAVGAGKAKPLIGGDSVSGGASPPKDQAEYRELEQRAMNGDKAAAARIMAMPSNRLI